MPDVSSVAPTDVRPWVALDVHKLSIVAATLPPTGGEPELMQIETTRTAVRRLIDRLGGPVGLAVCHEAGPGGFDLSRPLTEFGVACDVIAPSLIPVRAGDRIKTDRRDAKKPVRLYRGGQLSYVQPPSPEIEALRDRCAAAMICAARGPRPGTGSARSCSATAGSTVRAARHGRRCTGPGSRVSSSTTRSRTRRSRRCSPISTGSNVSSISSTGSWRRSPARPADTRVDLRRWCSRCG